MVIDVASHDELVADGKPLDNLFSQIFIEGNARVAVLVLGLEVGLVLGPNRGWATLVLGGSIEADATQNHAILAREARPSPSA